MGGLAAERRRAVAVAVGKEKRHCCSHLMMSSSEKVKKFRGSDDFTRLVPSCHVTGFPLTRGLTGVTTWCFSVVLQACICLFVGLVNNKITVYTGIIFTYLIFDIKIKFAGLVYFNRLQLEKNNRRSGYAKLIPLLLSLQLLTANLLAI